MGTSASSAVSARIRTFVAACAAMALAWAAAPVALADDGQPASSPAAPVPPALAAEMIQEPTAFVSSEVVLAEEADVVVGSFTVEGLTFALSGDGATLIAVDPSAVVDGAIEVPATVEYEGTGHPVTAIGAFAFYLSGAIEVVLPESIASVDDRAFRSSDVERVEVDSANPNVASFDGCLYDSQLKSLLLILEGRAGAILLPKTAEVVEAGKFSHCSLVDAISVEEGGAAFASWEGLLYSADGTTLLRVPAGATDVTIREGCTTIAAGAMEGCAKLERISAPATVTSISPDVLTQETSVFALPAAALGEADSAGAGGEDEAAIPQVTGTVALAAVSGGISAVDPTTVTVALADDAPRSPWQRIGFKVEGGIADFEEDASLDTETATKLDQESDEVRQMLPASVLNETVELEEEPLAPVASTQSSNTYATGTLTLRPNNGTLVWGPYSDSLTTCSHADHRGTKAADHSLAAVGENITVYTNGSNNLIHLRMGSTKCYVSVTAERVGHTFLGWSVDGVNVIPNGTQYGGNLSVMALWRVNAYSITWNPNGGVWSDNTTTAKTSSHNYGTVQSGYNGTGRPTKAGYTFNGWSASSTAATGDSSVTVGDKAATYHAVWTKNPVYTVTLNNNGGSGGTSTAYLWYGKGWYSISSPTDTTTAMISITAPTKAGYTFKGYATSETATTAAYWTSTSTMPSNTAFLKATDLYAVWQKNAVYKITLDKQKGSGGTTTIYQWTGKGFYSISSPTESSTPITSITAPTRTGYTYSGYYTAANGGGTCRIASRSLSSLSNTTFTADTKLYAYWMSRPRYTITLNANGGAPNAEIYYVSEVGYIASYDSDDFLVAGSTLAITLPTRTGYTFAGYFSSATGGTQYVDASGKLLEDAPFTDGREGWYAQWGHVVTFDRDPGSGGTESLVVADGAAIGSVTTPTLSGWSFSGYTNNFGTTTNLFVKSNGVGTTRTISQDMTLKANWTKTVTLDANGGTKGSLTSLTAGIGRPLGQKCTSVSSTSADYPIRSLFSKGITDSSDWKPTRSYQVFQGYYDKATGGTCYIDKDGKAQSVCAPVTKDMPSTLYAHWAPYSAVLDPNEGTLSIYKSFGMASADFLESVTTRKTVEWVYANRIYGSNGVVHLTTATSPSTVQRGYQVKRVGYTFNGWDGSHKIGPGVDAELKNGATYTATWKANDYAVTFDANGGSGGQSEQVTATYDSDMPDISSEKPKRDGYTFMGWYDNADYAASGSKQYYTAEGKSARKYDKAGTCKLYAGWSAYPTMTIEGNGGLLGVTIDQANANADGSHHVGEVIAQNQESWTVGFLSAAAYPSIIHYWRDNYLHAIRAQRVGYTQTGWGGTITVNASTGSIGIGDGYRLAAEWTANRYSILLDAQDGSEAETINATYDADVTLPEPKKQGSIFHGWNTEPDGSGERYGAGIALSKPNLTAEANGSVTLYAQWMSTLSVDVPLEVTAQVDLLGLEEQVEATGWIESRSGGALKVAEVSFTPLGGATELFGSRTADVFLEAFAEGSTSADVSFALDAADAESDPDRLVPFALPDGYGTRIGVGYRFVIPDEVLSSIDPSRFEQATTPVGQVVYTVALAS